MSRAIVILSIFRSLGCFFVIPPHCVKNAVHLHISHQFIFSHTTPDGFFTFITRHPSNYFCFSFTWDYHRPIPFFSRFFLSLIFQRMWACSPVCLCISFHTFTSQIVFSKYDVYLFLLLQYIPDTIFLCLNTSPSYFICFSVLKSPQITN